MQGSNDAAAPVHGERREQHSHGVVAGPNYPLQSEQRMDGMINAMLWNSEISSSTRGRWNRVDGRRLQETGETLHGSCAAGPDVLVGGTAQSSGSSMLQWPPCVYTQPRMVCPGMLLVEFCRKKQQAADRGRRDVHSQCFPPWRQQMDAVHVSCISYFT